MYNKILKSMFKYCLKYCFLMSRTRFKSMLRLLFFATLMNKCSKLDVNVIAIAINRLPMQDLYLVFFENSEDPLIESSFVHLLNEVLHAMFWWTTIVFCNALVTVVLPTSGVTWYKRTALNHLCSHFPWILTDIRSLTWKYVTTLSLIK